VILREIDSLLKICWTIPCLHLSWKVHTCCITIAIVRLLNTISKSSACNNAT